MNLTKNNFNWNIIDTNTNQYSGKNLLFIIDDKYELYYSHTDVNNGQFLV